jgi:hypothetical protein
VTISAELAVKGVYAGTLLIGALPRPRSVGTTSVKHDVQCDAGPAGCVRPGQRLRPHP